MNMNDILRILMKHNFAEDFVEFYYMQFELYAMQFSMHLNTPN